MSFRRSNTVHGTHVYKRYASNKNQPENLFHCNNKLFVGYELTAKLSINTE